MSRKPKVQLKLQIKAGAANPAPPIGSSLGQHGVNIQQFCQRFNDATKEMGEDIIPTVIKIYDDRSFDFTLKTPPASALLRQAAGIEKGSGDILKKKAGKVTERQIQEIAERKMQDLNAVDLRGAAQIIKGTARSMGIETSS